MTRRNTWDRSHQNWDHRSPIDQWEGDWNGTDPVDMTGRPIQPGMWLVKTYQSGRSCNLEIRQVREVRKAVNGDRIRVFLDDSRVPIEYPGRCLIVDWDPQAERLTPVNQVIATNVEVRGVR